MPFDDRHLYTYLLRPGALLDAISEGLLIAVSGNFLFAYSGHLPDAISVDLNYEFALFERIAISPSIIFVSE